mgnify:CR=1 FL=1
MLIIDDNTQHFVDFANISNKIVEILSGIIDITSNKTQEALLSSNLFDSIIDNYKKEFPGIQLYMDKQINNAKELGFVETLMGRRRWLRDINSSNFTVRGFAERNAINSPIQGSAADMIKLAMIKIHAEMKKTKWESKMILQVHDELVFDAVEKELPKLKELILKCMKEAMVLPNGVPVEAEVGVGKNWLEAH